MSLDSHIFMVGSQEQWQPPDTGCFMIDEIITGIRRHAKLKPRQNLIVGVSGIDGSGKSTLAKELEHRLVVAGLPALRISLDDFLNPRKIRHKNEDQVVGYFEDNFDYDRLVSSILEPARNSTLVRAKLPVLNLDTDQITEWPFDFAGPGVLIIEGVFLFRKELRDKFDFKIWLEISFESAMKRILKRPRDRRYGEADAIRLRYEQRFFPTQAFHIKRDNPSGVADMIINVT